MTKSLSACSSSVAVVNSKIIASSYKPGSFCTDLNMLLLPRGSSQPLSVLSPGTEIYQWDFTYVRAGLLDKLESGLWGQCCFWSSSLISSTLQCFHITDVFMVVYFIPLLIPEAHGNRRSLLVCARSLPFQSPPCLSLVPGFVLYLGSVVITLVCSEVLLE